jgi:O-acetyl-ADP-ribose deacetylase (regulator of RNase III)
MIDLTRGNLLLADTEALVNTVNTVGVMGKGIALQFKQAFPENYRAYRRACEAGEVQIGKMFVFDAGPLSNPRHVINFPTKRHWRGKSRLGDVVAGLAALSDEIRAREIRSVAVPPLGCGNGGLDWRDVRPLIENALRGLEGVSVLLFEPVGAPDLRTMPVRTERPRMTAARALLIQLLAQYSVLGYSRSLLEVQKLAYLLQEAGEPLRLSFERGHFGPYAANLNKVLERLEGHFTRGYGDSQKPDTEIQLLPGAAEEAERFLAGQAESRHRLERLRDLIAGFETPYGMELLSSVHWVVRHETPPASDPVSALGSIRRWSHRKASLFHHHHVEIAWSRLTEQAWI